MPTHEEDFCLIHGKEFMQVEFGNPIPYCAACEASTYTTKEVLDLCLSLVKTQIREERINSIEELYGFERMLVAEISKHEASP